MLRILRQLKNRKKKQKNTFHGKKQSLSFQNMLSKLWATYEMNFWERKLHGAFKVFKCN